MAIPLKAVTEKSISTPEDVRTEMRPQPSTSSKEAALQFDLSVAPLLPLLEAIKSSQDQIFLDEESKASLRRKLEIFLSLDHGMRVTAFLRSACWVSLCAALSNFLFLLQAKPHSYESWFAISIMALPVFLFLAPLAGILHSWTRKRRNEAARRFYELGFRVDAQGSLVTDSAHPQIVVTLSTSQDTSYLVQKPVLA